MAVEAVAIRDEEAEEADTMVEEGEEAAVDMAGKEMEETGTTITVDTSLRFRGADTGRVVFFFRDSLATHA